jgi:hypothetical protein
MKKFWVSRSIGRTTRQARSSQPTPPAGHREILGEAVDHDGVVETSTAEVVSPSYTMP